MKKKFPKLKHKAVLAPMSGITNVAFRSLCKSMGAAMTYTEFISTAALVRKDVNSFVAAMRAPNETPCGVQLFGNSEEEVLDAALLLQDSFDVIDINVGCPAYKVVRQGCGCELLKDPAKVGALVDALSSGLSKPVTVKIRSGINSRNINAVEVAKICEDNGAAAITVHARTQAQGYSGIADWKVIAAVKSAVRIPVIGNGDVRSEHDAARMLEETDCDYVMVGRQAKNDPHIFSRIDHFLETGDKLPSLTLDAQMRMLLDYFDLCRRFGLDKFEIYKQAAQNFTKSYDGGAKVRLSLNDAHTVEDVTEIIRSFGKI